MVIETISLVDQEPSSPLLIRSYPGIYVNMTWVTDEGAEQGSTCLAKSHYFNCSLIEEDKPKYGHLISGELFIAVNYTVANPKDDTRFLSGNARPYMIQAWPESTICSESTTLELKTSSGNAFPLFPGVHLRATLTMTAKRTDGNWASIKPQKVSCDAHNFSMSLIVCSVSRLVNFQYRPNVSRPRPAHDG